MQTTAELQRLLRVRRAHLIGQILAITAVAATLVITLPDLARWIEDQQSFRRQLPTMLKRLEVDTLSLIEIGDLLSRLQKGATAQANLDLQLGRMLAILGLVLASAMGVSAFLYAHYGRVLARHRSQADGRSLRRLSRIQISVVLGAASVAAALELYSRERLGTWMGDISAAVRHYESVSADQEARPLVAIVRLAYLNARDTGKLMRVSVFARAGAWAALLLVSLVLHAIATRVVIRSILDLPRRESIDGT